MRRYAPFILLLAGCVEDSIANPTGDCEPDDDGSRACYHSPGEGDQYLPDCAEPLAREYWRVFAQSETSAYMIPRPDAAGLTWGICEGEDADLAALFDTYTLCEETADVDVVNAMDPADALQIANALHQRLVFSAVDLGDEAADISPFAPEVDLADACAGPGADDPVLADICPELEGRITGDTCLDIGILFTLEEAQALASALNELYGIAAE